MSAPVVVQSTVMPTLVERVRRILVDGSPLSQEDWFILKQVHLICLFRRARTWSRKEKNDQYIAKRERDYLTQNKDKENSLTSQDFLALHQWIANQGSADKQYHTTKIETLIRRVKQRKKQAKKEAVKKAREK